MFAEQGKCSIASCQAFGRKAGVREQEQVRRSWQVRRSLQGRCLEASQAFGSKAVVQQQISSESNKAFGSILCVREKFRRSGARQSKERNKLGVREQDRCSQSKASVR